MTDGRRSNAPSSLLGTAVAVVTVAWLLFDLLRHRRGSSGAAESVPAATVGTDSTAGWATTPAEDLAADRRFERSLVLRQFVVVLGIAVLIVLRQLAG